MQNVSGIADDILVASFGEWGKDHSETLGEGSIGMQGIEPKT